MIVGTIRKRVYLKLALVKKILSNTKVGNVRVSEFSYFSVRFA